MSSELGIARLKRTGIEVNRTEEQSEYSKILSGIHESILRIYDTLEVKHEIYDTAALKIHAIFRHITVQQKLLEIKEILKNKKGWENEYHGLLLEKEPEEIEQLELLIQESCVNIHLFNDNAEQKSKWEEFLVACYEAIPEEYRNETFEIQEGLTIESEEGEEQKTILVGPISPEAKSLSGEIQEIRKLITGKRKEKTEIITQISKQDWTNYVRDLKEKFRDNRTRLEEIIHECEEELEICEPHEVYYWEQIIEYTKFLHRNIQSLLKTTSIPEREREIQSMYQDLERLGERAAKNIALKEETAKEKGSSEFDLAINTHLKHIYVFDKFKKQVEKVHEADNAELRAKIADLKEKYPDYLIEKK